MRLEAGATLAGGRYRLESLRGRGGMAVVWRAHDTQLDRPVAIKVIADALAADPDFRRRFEREARAAAAVSHPHVVKLFDYGLDADVPYLVMEYVDGPSLAELQKAGGTASVDVRALANDLLEALCHIHKAGVVHRDIKPANLLMGPGGDLRVTDFGIARLDETTQITRVGMVVGTERYIAPEVAAGQPATPVSDLFSCGAVLRELVGGDAPGGLEPLIATLRSEDPVARPASAEAALELLRGRGRTDAGAAAPDPDSAPTAPLLGELGAGRPGVGEPPTGRVEDARDDQQTAPTAQLPPGRPPADAHVHGAARRPRPRFVIESGDRRVALAPVSAVAGALALAGVALVAFLAFRGDGAPERASVPDPAPETAPLGTQLERLEAIVRQIGENQRP